MLSPEVLDLIKRTVAELGLGAGAHTLEFGARSVPFSAPLTMRAAPGAPKPSVARRAVGDMAPEGDPAEGEPDGPEAPTSEMTVYRLSGTASSTSVDCRSNGATSSRFVRSSGLRLARWRKTASASAVISGSVVRKPRSV
jgi:hypothetical protein